ncbi:type 1 glutamine amidotransferase [Paraoerskovia sediminicola]|uniref:type 1 glutamine amidotransferase n=1 Tax=Paraoerskovia sediminicola TaxID=1138587 RepID=UPI00257325F2|nr:type 1 glutamine amidotransferase [Paraoerskovia sediminicola]
MNRTENLRTEPVVTVVQSDPDFGLGTLAAAIGDGARVLRTDLGEVLPPLHEVGDALVVLGGGLAVHADAPWLSDLRDLLREAVSAGVPVLAIGLGAQLLAVATGGRVEIAPPPGPERGVTSLYWRRGACDDAVLGRVVDVRARTTPVVGHHSDAIVDLPAEAVWLGSSSLYPFQGFRVGSALGLQFQPEADAALVAGWAAHLDADQARTLRTEFALHEEEVARTGAALGAAFMAQVRASIGDPVDA